MKIVRDYSMGVVAAMLLSPLGPIAHASDTGAFIGGMLTSKVLHSMSDRTQAEQVTAYNSSAQARENSATAASTPQQKLDQLDSLAANGYITKEEYNARRKAILDTM